MKRTIRTALTAVALAMACLSAYSCQDKEDDFDISEDTGGRISQPRIKESYDKVLLFYECGFNSLYSDLREDMEDELESGYIPSLGDDDVLLVYSKFALNTSYAPVKSYLRRLYTDSSGQVQSDTLLTFSESVLATSSSTMQEVISYAKNTYHGTSFGMVFSSHGSGWLPAGYYNSPSSYEASHTSSLKLNSLEDVPQGTMSEDDPFAGFVRSIGQDVSTSSDDVEMTTSEFAEGISVHLDYLLFDMCFSGGVEVLYPLRNLADYVLCSPAEVLADGMYDYTKITDYLLKSDSPDLEGLAEDSFENYNSMTGTYRSSTVSLVRSSGMDNLADVCKSLTEKYRSELAALQWSSVQGYYRQNRHYFFDLEDMFAKAGASSSDLQTLSDAIDGCMVYCNATPQMLESFSIDTYSGLSMYLPCSGTTLLNSEYTNEAWNSAVGLVE